MMLRGDQFSWVGFFFLSLSNWRRVGSIICVWGAASCTEGIWKGIFGAEEEEQKAQIFHIILS